MRDPVSTKDTAEATLRESPSVLGAFVREDVNGHPREVHLLVTPGPNPRDLARDVRALLEERLGIQVDQRVISIAQLSRNLDPLPPESVPEDETTAPPAAALANAAPLPPPHSSSQTAATAPQQTPETTQSAQPVLAPEATPRVIYQGIESSTREGRVEIRVRLTWQEREYSGTGREMDGGLGRIRAAATATLLAASEACSGRVRLDLESASTTRALGREYVLISVLATSPTLGRRPLTLIGAQPLEFDAETSAALAALQATNRIVALVLNR
jgi:hypothetical protein